MTSQIWDAGTITVTNGSTLASGTGGTGWLTAAVRYGTVEIGNRQALIASVEGEGAMTFARPWSGPNYTGPYAILRRDSAAADLVAIYDKFSASIIRHALTALQPRGAGDLTKRDALVLTDDDDGFVWLHAEDANVNDWQYYVWQGVVDGWVGPQAVFIPGEDGNPGDPGPAGDGFNPVGAWLISTLYDKNDMVTFGGRSFVSKVDDNTGNQPPSADEDDANWMFVPAAKGDPGTPIELQTTATHIQWRYVGDPTWTDLVALADISGEDGDDGNDGWSPVLAAVSDGERRVHQVVDWVGGEGVKPATGNYVGPSGLTPTIGDATDVRGPSGSGTGDVSTSGSVTALRLVVYADGTGDLIQDSGVAVSDLATAAQGSKADTAVQPGALGTAAARNVGTSSGNVPVLGAGGVLDESVLPALAITDTFEVASQSAMLALTAQRGDVAVRSDLNKCFILKQSPASTLANWVELRTPIDAVLSVAGLTGAISGSALKAALSLAKGDVGLGNVDNTSDANKPVSSAQQTALDGKETAGQQVGINTQTGATYTLVLADKGKVVEMNNGSANTLTIPPNSSVAFPVNSRIDLAQLGAGQTTIAAGSGVTIRSADGKLKLNKQYSGATLYKRGTDEWVLVGDLVA